jgi:hypothetical protein
VKQLVFPQSQVAAGNGKNLSEDFDSVFVAQSAVSLSAPCAFRSDPT